MRPIDADALFLPDEKSDKVCIIGNRSGKMVALAVELLKRKVADAPTIEAEPVVHSRWVKDRDGDEYCENCSRYMPVREVTGDPSANNYCPNCGAKMDGDFE